MGLQRSLVRPQVARSLGSNDRHIGRGLRSPPPHASEATYPERVKVGEELFFGPADDLPCSRRRGVRGGGRIAVRRVVAGGGGLDAKGARRGEIGAARRPGRGQSGHLRPAAARAPSACGRQPASRRRLLFRRVELSPSRRFTSGLLPAAGASYKAGQEDDRRCGATAPALLTKRSRRRGT